MPATARGEYGRINRAIVCNIRYHERLEITLRVDRYEELVQMIVWYEEHDLLPVQLVDEGVALSGTHAVCVARVTEMVGAVGRELGELNVYHVPSRHAAEIPLLRRHGLRLDGGVGRPRSELGDRLFGAVTWVPDR